MTTNDLGDTVYLTFVVKDATGALANAGAVTCTVTAPDGSQSTPAASNPSTGNYLAPFVTAQLGHHSYRFVATGANAQARADVFEVVDGSGAIVSLADIRAHLKLTSTSNDDELIRMRDAAESFAESYTNAVLRKRTILGEAASGGTSAVTLRERPVQSIVAARENGITLASNFYTLNPPAGTLVRTSGYPYYPATWLAGYLNISVDYVAGWGNAAPADLRDAILEIVRIKYNESQRGTRATRRSSTGDEYQVAATLLPPVIKLTLDNYIALGVA